MSFELGVTELETLKKEFDKKDNLKACQEIYAKLKLSMLPFAFSQSKEVKEHLFCREVLEYGALISIKSKDINAFQRNIASVKHYYNDFGDSLPKSDRQLPLLGLYLLYLLAFNKFDEFHTELELIPSEQQENKYIKYAIELEQFMMEGSYHKVIKAKQNPPTDSYLLFIEPLMETVRAEIADCIQVSYASLTFSEAAKLLGFSSNKEVEEFAQKHDWKTNNDSLVFPQEKPEKTSVPTYQLIQHNLKYARELERII